MSAERVLIVERCRADWDDVRAWLRRHGHGDRLLTETPITVEYDDGDGIALVEMFVMRADGAVMVDADNNPITERVAVPWDHGHP